MRGHRAEVNGRYGFILSQTRQTEPLKEELANRGIVGEANRAFSRRSSIDVRTQVYMWTTTAGDHSPAFLPLTWSPDRGVPPVTTGREHDPMAILHQGWIDRYAPLVLFHY